MGYECVFSLLFVDVCCLVLGRFWAPPGRHDAPRLPEEGGHLQRVQPRAADEGHQVDGIVAHAARDHQEGLGTKGVGSPWG